MISERLAALFPEGIPTDFDWSDKPVAEGEEVLGDATEDLLRLHQLVTIFAEEIKPNCKKAHGAVEALMTSGEPLTSEKILELLQMTKGHQLEHSRVSMLQKMFWDDIAEAFPKKNAFERVALRQGRKIVGIDPIEGIDGITMLMVSMVS